MTITYYDNEIQRASGFFDENGNPDPYCVYADSGQGCRTVWFKSVEAARRAILSEEGLKHGYDLFDCTKCGCHYSITQDGFKNILCTLVQMQKWLTLRALKKIFDFI